MPESDALSEPVGDSGCERTSRGSRWFADSLQEANFVRDGGEGILVDTEVSSGTPAIDRSRPRRRARTAIDAPAVPGRARRYPLWFLPTVVFLIGLIVTATLAMTARTLHASNENRLLRQRVSEAGTVIGAASATTQAPLSASAALVEATRANPASFTKLMKPLAAGQPFISVSVWPAHVRRPRPLVVVGQKPELAQSTPAEQRAYLDHATTATSVVLRDLLGARSRRLGYAYSVGRAAKYVVYAETELEPRRRARVESNSAFSDLDYAIYLGTTDDLQDLIASSVADPHFTGRSAATTVPFGDGSLRLVMAPRRELGGSLLARLPWLIVAFGVLISLAAALLTDRLVRRRAHAEELARLNARLFSDQRSVAQTLQHSLLPAESPTFPGLEFAVRYEPGVDGVDIGGDWYDVVDVGDGRLMLVVGDVSGRGLQAATVMASLRYAIRAYAAQGDAPEVILYKLAKLIDVRRDRHFATVLCGLVDVAERRVAFANAGHPNPLLITEAGAQFIRTEVGAPVGVANRMSPATTVSIPDDAVLLAYTDGLFERRGESPDVGLERLREAAGGYSSLDELLDGLLRKLTPDGGNDDTAILAVRWLP
jgi:serine phosphatase RsbU (regulator of sigma subunit)